MHRKTSGLKTLIVTGGIASGKSVACSFLKKRGVPVYCADLRAKELYSEDPHLLPSLERSLGQKITDSSGKLDKSLLAGTIFSDPVKKAIVDSIVHPRIVEDYKIWKDAQTSDRGIAVMETAIFPDREPLASVADYVMLVRSDRETRVQRAVSRGLQTEEDIQNRMKMQSYDEAEADFIIDNDSDLGHLRESVEEVLGKLSKIMLNLPDD